MKLQRVRILKCPECTGLFKPDESVSVFTVGNCPLCGKNIRAEPMYLVEDVSLKS